MVETVLSIPIGNDFVERVFSIMNNIWSNDRNCMKVDLVKAEICICVNYSMSCNEFSEYVIKNNELLRAAKSNQKYTFKFKKPVISVLIKTLSNSKVSDFCKGSPL